jgi:hypothetical protein
LGFGEIKGYDGVWVDKNSLLIPKECFEVAELNKGIILSKKYDLAISLEVAEHLPVESADIFIETLTNSADFVLFSAAIPYQGGTNHINERWPDYWNNLFNKNGFIAIDCVRPRIWNDPNIASWYKQNIILFVKREVSHLVKAAPHEFCHDHAPLALIHPDLYIPRCSRIRDYSSRKLLSIVVRRILRRMMNLLKRKDE